LLPNAIAAAGASKSSDAAFGLLEVVDRCFVASAMRAGNLALRIKSQQPTAGSRCVSATLQPGHCEVGPRLSCNVRRQPRLFPADLLVAPMIGPAIPAVAIVRIATPAFARRIVCRTEFESASRPLPSGARAASLPGFSSPFGIFADFQFRRGDTPSPLERWSLAAD